LTRPRLLILLPCILLITLLAFHVSAWEQISPPTVSMSKEYNQRFEALQVAAKKPKQPAPHRPGHILVKFKEKLSKAMIDSVQTGFNAVSARQFRHVKNLHLIRLPKSLGVDQAIAAYKKHPDVLYAEPDYIVKALGMPNDPSFSSLWGLMNTGQNNGTAGSDVNAPGAWDVTTGSKDVVVAVIDTGIDYTHQDLADNIWSNKAECNANGIDDDGNGYIDDCHGINVVDRFSPPMDDYGHGSHVSGTIGAMGNNAIGVVGVNWDISLMACKFLDSTGRGSTSGAIECLDYVRDMKSRGVNIVATNNSWGGGDYSQALYEAIGANLQAGILFIVAAGNSGNDNETYPTYPASYSLPNVIAVSATDESDSVAFFSDDGRRSVHIGAPGTDILSTTPDNGYETHSGTSMATPHVTGVAALLKAQDPTRDWTAIRNIILSSGKSVPSLWNTISQKRLDAAAALTCTDRVLVARLSPQPRAIRVNAGETVNLSVLHVNCAIPNGEVTVTVQPGGDTIALKDDGNSTDIVKGDGIYSGQWIASKEGIFLLNIPGDDTLPIQVVSKYPTLFRDAKAIASNLTVSAVAVGDINADGRSDIVYAIPGTSPGAYSYFYTLLQDSSGNLVSGLSQPVGIGWVNSIAIGDVNNDGRSDLVVVHSGDDPDYFLGIFLQDSTGSFRPIIKYATSNVLRVRIGDLNGDGLPDIACVGGAADTVQIFYQNKDGTLSEPVSLAALNSGEGLEIADLNNDGLNDIVVGSSNGSSKPSIGILYQTSAGAFQPPVYRYLRGRPDWGSTGVFGLAIGDLNGDGLKDIAASSDHSLFAGVFTQNGSGMLNPPVTYPSLSITSAIKVADVNSDGRDDMVVANPGSLAVYLQTPTGTFFPSVVHAPYNPQYSDIGSFVDGLAIGDVNGDGLADIVAVDLGRLLVYYGDPNGSQGMATTLYVQTEPYYPNEYCGRGSVVSDPPGINCGPGSVCAATFPFGTRVHLTGVPEPGSVLRMWQGACEHDSSGGCTVTVRPGLANVAASFAFTSTTVTVIKDLVSGAKGNVISDLPGINCGPTCQADFSTGWEYVQLRTVPDQGYRFIAWGGSCVGTAADQPCFVVLDVPRTAYATFGPPGLYLYPIGHGTITSDPPGINCTGVNDLFTSCPPFSFPPGSTVTLSATPSPGWKFDGWIADNCLDTGPCKVVMNKDVIRISPTFAWLGFRVTVTMAGAGYGTVTSNPPGIKCLRVCSASFTEGQQVVLTATPSAGSRFSGWTGCPSPSGVTCTLTMNTILTMITASFDPVNTLTVTKTGMGSVTSTPSGIDCGTTCSATFAPGSTVTLNAIPSPGYAFGYWSGACSGASTTCNVLMSNNAGVTAVFVPVKTKEYRLGVMRRKLDKGDGAIMSSDGMITCGSPGGSCAHIYYPHTPVTLSAAPSENSTFTGWSGACVGTGLCNVAMDKARSVIATFVGPQKLTVRKQSVKRGTGMVTGSLGGIDCGTDCPSASASYPLHQTVTLTATPDEGSMVTAWKPKSLNCSGTGCTVRMEKDVAVTVTFSKTGVKGEDSDEDGE